jgi:hypothetical protein
LICFQAYQAEGRTKTPTKARLAATIRDCVGSELQNPEMKYLARLVIAMITATPKSKNPTNALITNWIRDGQWSGDFNGWIDVGMVDIIKIIFPGTG